MKKLFFLIIFLCFIFNSGYAQRNYKLNKKTYQTALKFFSREEYGKALKLFLMLDSVNVDDLIRSPNENQYLIDDISIPEIKLLIKYHIGLCYISSKTDKSKAIPYLEYILKSNYNREPENIYIDLGTLYHLNYQFSKAALCFEKFIRLYNEKDIQKSVKVNENYELAKRMLSICREAQTLYNDSLKINIKNIGSPVNSENKLPFPSQSLNLTSEFNPFITADNSRLFFNRTTYFIKNNMPDSVTEVMVSTKFNSKWLIPLQISFPNQIKNKLIILAGLSIDGQELFLNVKDEESVKLYTCIFSGTKCDNLQKLNAPVNSIYNQGKASLSANGTELFFSSDMPGGFGNMDLYKSVKNDKGEWTKPENLGPDINSKFDEISPFIHADNKTLYFCSDGNLAMGGFDIFNSFLKDNHEWSLPENIGYPINTVSNETDISISASGQTGYFSKIDNVSGKRKIYSFILNQNIPLTLVKGTILAGEPLKPVAAKIKVIDKLTNTRVKYIYDPNPTTGQYLMIFPPGKDYDVIVESKDFLPQLINIHIPNQTYFYELFQEIHLKPLNLLNKKLGEEVSVSNTFIDIYKTPSGNDVISKSGGKDYSKLINLVEKLISTTDSIGLEKIDKTFEKIFKEEQIKKDSTYRKDIGRLLDFIGKAIETSDSTTLTLLDKNTLYRKDYTQKYFYSEDKPIDLHKVIINKDTILTTPPLNTKIEANKTKADSALLNIIHKESKPDVKEIKPEEKKYILTYNVFFASGKADIENKYYSEMKEIVRLLKYNSDLYIEIFGYCDSKGGIEENNQLSELRANKVLKYFNEIGINTETATVKGFGKTYSANEKTEKDRQFNRRVDVKIFEYIKK